MTEQTSGSSYELSVKASVENLAIISTDNITVILPLTKAQKVKNLHKMSLNKEKYNER